MKIPNIIAAYDFRASLPHGFEYGIVALAILLLIGGLAWRRQMINFLALLSLALMAVAIVALPLTWSVSYDAQLFDTFFQADGTSRTWYLFFDSAHGGYSILWEVRQRPSQRIVATMVNSRVRIIISHDASSHIHYPTLTNVRVTQDWRFVEDVLGFRFAWNTFPANPGHLTIIGQYGFVVPHWFVLLLCLPFPLIWFHRFRRRRYRLRHNLCLACGYDLRESPEKCPECGAHVQAAAASIQVQRSARIKPPVS